MTEHPYKSAPGHTFWRRSVAEVDPASVDPVVDFPFRIDPTMRVATAGSCFAQHIARYLRNSGFNYHVTEPGHPIIPESVRAKNNYGLFSARYGNIYTARQLIQLFERAYGRFVPQEPVWQESEDRFLDPFRPSTQPGGYISAAELELDRAQHLAAVREMFETLDVFVFTLGLTECWVSRADGAAFPICPGVEGGVFDPERYAFHNQSCDEVVSDMTAFLMGLARVNPRAQVILTVSPVPLAATARRDQHVLTATAYSKAVLRVAAETLAARFAHVAYFPSYEIITGAFNRGGYYAPDLRNVVEAGVAHVMGLFMKHATRTAAADPVPEPATPVASRSNPANSDAYLDLSRHIVEVECDEAALDRS
ncbi:GSCFA domain-containing protein [Novosphingobium piscinae]|uniref:GSCFA domain-containing protein n=1 Tax=Novosphingobium piscinae TaxID=1507448 RepID=A0A7X1FXY7_9SPHN|nr:GSCFA domain-containing protein [Novosphingobium piscinae]MBC2669065.1 GSCFA domain-containing protein [Novosphingobium piscinae]